MVTTRSCGKVRYRTRHQADTALENIRRAPKRELTPCRAYPCDRCNGWHLTHHVGEPR